MGPLETETRAPNSNLIFDFIFDFCPIIWRQLISLSLPCHIPFYSFTHTIRSTRFGVMFFFFHKLFYLLFLLLFVLFCLFFFRFSYMFFSVFWWLPLKLNKRMFIIYIFIYIYIIYSTINMANYNTLFIAYRLHTYIQCVYL